MQVITNQKVQIDEFSISILLFDYEPTTIPQFKRMINQDEQLWRRGANESEQFIWNRIKKKKKEKEKCDGMDVFISIRVNRVYAFAVFGFDKMLKRLWFLPNPVKLIDCCCCRHCLITTVYSINLIGTFY